MTVEQINAVLADTLDGATTLFGAVIALGLSIVIFFKGREWMKAAMDDGGGSSDDFFSDDEDRFDQLTGEPLDGQGETEGGSGPMSDHSFGPDDGEVEGGSGPFSDGSVGPDDGWEAYKELHGIDPSTDREEFYNDSEWDEIKAEREVEGF